jgi:TfoX/Sxy family transcriptional regulator of competence genes
MPRTSNAAGGDASAFRRREGIDSQTLIQLTEVAYDEQLAARVRALLRRRKGVAERRMFGGLCFLLNGNMACGVQQDRLVLRLGPDGAARALQQPHTTPMDFTGRALASMVYVQPAGCRDDTDLRRWLDDAVRFARTLPAK